MPSRTLRFNQRFLSLRYIIAHSDIYIGSIKTACVYGGLPGVKEMIKSMRVQGSGFRVQDSGFRVSPWGVLPLSACESSTRQLGVRSEELGVVVRCIKIRSAAEYK